MGSLMAASRLLLFDDSEALLDGIVEAAPIGIGFLDGELRCRRMNRALAALVAGPRDLDRGPRLSELLPDLVDDAVEDRFRAALATGEPVVDLELSGAVPRREGRQTWRVTCYPVQRRDAPPGLALLARDVTEEKRAAELQQLLVGVVGHDLRNPLSIVAGAAALLSRGDLAPDARERNVARIRDAGRRMEELVGRLLDYTRACAGAAIAIQPVAGDLEQVLRAVAEDCAAAHPGVDVTVAGAGDGWGCWDVARLQQVFANLVNNAFKYGRRGAPVVVRWSGAADRVRVEVENEGEPIDAEARERIFEPLSQIAAGRRGGIGLGLFIAREIVRAHSGAIDVRSRGGRTTFSVELPRRCAPTSPSREEARAQG
jgi:signal transduction histidine kinase